MKQGTCKLKSCSSLTSYALLWNVQQIYYSVFFPNSQLNPSPSGSGSFMNRNTHKTMLKLQFLLHPLYSNRDVLNSSITLDLCVHLFWSCKRCCNHGNHGNLGRLCCLLDSMSRGWVVYRPCVTSIQTACITGTKKVMLDHCKVRLTRKEKLDIS